MWKSCRHFEVEHRNLLGLSLEDRTIEDSVDDTTCIRDRDTLASTVPTSVNEISLSTRHFHLSYELLSVLSRVQLEECLTEASRESRSWLCDTTLCSSELSCEAREEVVLSLCRCEDRNWREHTECISREEDNILSSRSRRTWLDVVDMVDRVRNTSVLSNLLVSEIDLAFSVNSYVLKESVTLDSAVDVRLVFLREVDNLSIATTFEVEYAVIVPSVLVITDKATLRVCRESGLTSTRETEEDSCVLTVHVTVSRAVHRSDALEREVVVHHREHTLLHLTTVPCVDDNLLAACHVECDASL